MYVALPQLLYLWDMEEQRGLATKWVKPQRKGIFMGGEGGGIKNYPGC